MGHLEYNFGNLLDKMTFLISSRRTRYKMNVMRQTAYLVVYSITVNNFAFLFNCTLAGRASDLTKVPTLKSIYLI